MATIPYPGAHPSISAAISAANPGDVIEIAAGTYNESITFGGGDSGITLRGVGNVIIDGAYALPGGTLVGDDGTFGCTTQPGCVSSSCDALPSVYGGLLQINGSTDIVIENLHLKDSFGRGISMDGGSSILVQDVEISGARRSAIVVEGNGSSFTGNRLDIHDNILFKSYDGNSPNWPIAVGSKQFDGFNITNSDIYRNWGEGLSFDRDTTNVVFRGNRIWDNWALQLYVHNVVGAVVEDNLVWVSSDETYERGCNPSAGIVINTEQFLIDQGAPPTANVEVRNNLVYSRGSGLSIWDNENYSTSDNINIYNNTFVGYGGGTPITGHGSNGQYSDSSLQNNIFWTVDGSPSADGSNLDSGFTQVGNNLFGDNSFSASMGAGAIVGNPLLANPPSSIAPGALLNPADFHLTSGSTVIDAGAATAAGDDYLGNIRVNHDIGFHEFDALVNNPPTVDATSQANTMGDSVSYQPVGNDIDGDTLTWSATGLPPTLSIDPATGLITGTASTVGTYSYTVTVTDGVNPPVSDTATWIVSEDAPPAIGYKLVPPGCSCDSVDTRLCDPSTYLDANGQWGWGTNLAWRLYGVDFPTNEGDGSHWFMTPATAQQAFGDVAAAGGQYVRWWLWADARGGPEFDANGFATGLDATTCPELGQVLDIAAQEGITLVLTLWNHDITAVPGYTPNGGNRADLITDQAKTQAMIDNALIPLLNCVTPNGVTFGNHPNLHIDIFNEPELGMNDLPHRGVTGAAAPGAPKNDIQRFIGMQLGAIKDNFPSLPVTVAPQEIGYIDAFGNIANGYGHYWSDAEMMVHGGPNAAFDYYTPHWYDAFQGQTYMNPLDYSASDFDRPVFLGEVEGDGSFTAENVEQLACQGWQGVWPWTYFGTTDQYGSWAQTEPVIQEFYQNAQ